MILQDALFQKKDRQAVIGAVVYADQTEAIKAMDFVKR